MNVVITAGLITKPEDAMTIVVATAEARATYDAQTDALTVEQTKTITAREGQLVVDTVVRLARVLGYGGRQDDGDGDRLRNVRNCVRCGRGHDDLPLMKFAQPFTPPEANGQTWTHWTPCPTNGDPILVMFVDEAKPEN